MEYWMMLLPIVIGVISIYTYLLRNFNIFKRHGLIHIPPIPIFGAMISVILRRTTMVDSVMKLYNFNPNAKYYGFYYMTLPFILLRDPELIKTVLIKNFEAFPNRCTFSQLTEPLLSNNVFSLRVEKWRNVRALLNPSFTSCKMKILFSLMSECAVDFVKFLSTLPADKREMNMKDAFTKYTNDVIATCTFGIKIDSMNDPTNKFFVFGKEAANIFGLKMTFIANFPTLARLLNIRVLRDYIPIFYKNVIETTISTRDAEHITRPDMLQLMMDIRGKEDHKELNIDDMTAQAFIIYAGGLDITSTTLCYTAHEIAANPEVQAKLLQEFDQVLEESNGEVSYEAINRLEYLDAVISEALRLYPSIPILERVCEKTFELPPTLPNEKPFIMKKNMAFWISILAIHRDEKYYDNPEKFCPERFLDKNKTYHNSPYYMPFGLGPRMCMGKRFAMLEMKILLFHLLARCELKLSAKTAYPIIFQKSIMMIPENGFWLNIQPRKDVHPALKSTIMNS